MYRFIRQTLAGKRGLSSMGQRVGEIPNNQSRFSRCGLIGNHLGLYVRSSIWQFTSLERCESEPSLLGARFLPMKYG